jgi:hypothetical protein
VGALVVGGYLERRTGAGRRLLEDERDIAAGQPVVPQAHPLLQPELSAQIDQVEELGGRQVGLLEQVASLQVHLVLLGGIPFDRAGHAARPAPAAAQLAADDEASFRAPREARR